MTLDKHRYSALQVSQDNRLYFFQFPAPFPSFLPRKPVPDEDMSSESARPSESVVTDDITASKGDEPTLKRSKSVSFAPETKPPVPSPGQQKDDTTPDGVIGQLEVYKSGAVKMRLGDGILLDVRLIAPVPGSRLF